MQKIIDIDGKKITFSTNFAWMLRYKNQFGADPSELIMGIISSDDPQLGFVDAAQLAWACAAAADPDIDPFEEWVESFDSFPVMSIVTDLLPEIIKSLASTKKAQTSASSKTTAHKKTTR